MIQGSHCLSTVSRFLKRKESNKTFPFEDILQTEIKSLKDCMFQMSHVDRSIFLKMFLSCETCHYFLDNIIR